MVSPEELEKEIESLVAECGKDLERHLRHGKIRLPDHLVGEVINDALLYAAGTPGLGATGRQHQDGDDMLENAEISYDLRSAIRRLSRRQQQVIELRYLRDFTVEETAQILKVAKGTVGPTTATALHRLKEMMAEHGGTRDEETG